MIRHPHFFGYGSLVNTQTHSYPAVQDAKLDGWRRVWRHTSRRPVAYLTVQPAEGSQIDGIIAAVPDADWAALDAREHAYLRNSVTQRISAANMPTETAVYAIPDGHHTDPTTLHPILLSYIDVVVQGYLQRFGDPGVARFFETTDGWDAPIINDRAAPRYSRAQSLTIRETGLVDEWLAALSAQVQQAE